MLTVICLNVVIIGLACYQIGYNTGKGDRA